MSTSEEEEKHEFVLCIKALNDTTVTTLELGAKLSDSVKIIKAKYCNLTGIRVEDQIYVYRGLEMNDDDTLNKYRINKDTVIHAAILQTHNNDDDDDDDVTDIEFDPTLIDRPYYDFLTCCAGYCTLCCLLPLICAPDLIALNIVNNWEINNECLLSQHYILNLSLFLNISSLWSIISYSLFALWFFWYLRTSSFIVLNRVSANQLEWKGITRIMASTRCMNNLWWFLSFGLLVFSCIGIYIHDQQMSKIEECQYSTIGVVLLAWSAVHFVLSLVICGALCLICWCFMTSDNIFANVRV